MFFDKPTPSDHAPARSEAQIHALYRKLQILVHTTPRLNDFAEPLAETLANIFGADGIIVGRTHGYGIQIMTAKGCLSHMSGSLVEIDPVTARRIMTSTEAMIYKHAELSEKYPIDDITLGVLFDSLILAPMAMEGRPYGFMALVSQKPDYYSQEDVNAFRDIARFITMALSDIHKAVNRQELNHYERITNMASAPIAQLQSASVDMLQTLAKLRECFISGKYQSMVDPLSQAFARIESIAKKNQDLRAIMELGKTPDIIPSSLNIEQLIESVSDYNGTRLDEKNIDVILDVEPNIPNIEADFSILWQAIHEFVLNAMDALETLPPEAHRELVIRAYAAPNLVQLEISDNGPGISAADYPKIFEPGFTTRKKQKGLGLTRARLNILRLKGEVVVISPETGGTTVCILFNDEEHTPQTPVF